MPNESPHEPEHRKSPCLILGLGNPLRGDDGIGPYLIEQLQRQRLPDGTDLLDGGTGGLEIALEFAGREAVLVIDAAHFGGAPGEFRRFDLLRADLGRTQWGAGHEQGLLAAIELARALNGLPNQLLLYAIEPQCVEEPLRLSPEVMAAVPSLTSAIRDAVGTWRHR